MRTYDRALYKAVYNLSVPIISYNQGGEGERTGERAIQTQEQHFIAPDINGEKMIAAWIVIDNPADGHFGRLTGDITVTKVCGIDGEIGFTHK